MSDMRKLLVLSGLAIVPFLFDKAYAHGSCISERSYCTPPFTPEGSLLILIISLLAVASFGSFIFLKTRDGGPQLKRLC
jgi:hypothetical protein